MGIGIALWFGWPGEPGRWPLAIACVMLLLPLAGWLTRHYALWIVGVALSASAFGFLVAELRADFVAAPVLQGRYYGPIEGRIIAIDRAASERIRLTLDEVALNRRGPLPDRVRLTLHGDQSGFLPIPGQRVMMTGWLSPPESAAEPGGFDFTRFAWFRGLGAVGYVRTPVLVVTPPEGLSAAVARLRMWLSAAVQARIPGEPGAFAAAMLTGDRSAMGQAAVEDLRDSNLYHLVSISGVHMSLLTGFVYQSLRFLISLWPAFALRVPAHKLAAAAAMPVSFGYLVLAGGDVATLRAWLMVMVMLGAILADRRALSLRSVALAAILVLTLTPEALLEPGFQMSFAATAAMIAGLNALRTSAMWPQLSPFIRTPLLVVASSFFAGLASAPFAALHFNRVVPFGLIPNLIAAPIMGFLVMPGGVLLALLGPLGLDAPARLMLEWGTFWVLEVAKLFAEIDGALLFVPRPAFWALPALTFGGIFGVAARRAWRILGSALLLLALAAWVWPNRPAMLISMDGRLIGVLQNGERVLSHPRGAGFAVSVWLEADGDDADQITSAKRTGFTGPADDLRIQFDGIRVRHLRSPPPDDPCSEADLVVLAYESPRFLKPCKVIGLEDLNLSGALALRVNSTGQIFVTAARAFPPRRWTQGKTDNFGAKPANP